MTAKIFKSLCGNSRKWNTDHVAQTTIQGSPLYIVCDGVQSNPECGQLVRAFCREICSQKQPVVGKEGSIEPELRDWFARVAKNLKGNNLDNFSFCVAAAFIHNDRLYTVHAGDCRVGKVTSKGIEWLTIDHVPALQRYKAGKLSKTEYAEQRNKVAGWIKPTDTSSLEVNGFEYGGEQLLLCSDGFWNYADESRFLDGGVSEVELLEEVRRIESLGEDNLSVIFIDSK
ncbi:MAG: PP2C family serine/threonine-protein phosphatase [Porticoccaceae bacterium]